MEALKNKAHSLWKHLKASWQANGMTLLKMLVIYSAIIVIFEGLLRKSPLKCVQWILSRPDLFLMNLALLMGVSALLLLITRKPGRVVTIVGLISIILSVANISKYALRNVPVLFEDLFLVREVLALAPQLVNAKTVLMLAGAALGIAALIFAFRQVFKGTHMERRMPATVTVLAVCVVLLSAGHVSYARDLSLEKTGFLYGLTNPLRGESPIDVSVLQAQEGASKEVYVPTQVQLPEGVKPNIIIIQSEAFWDINKMPIELSRNPIPTFEALRQESRYGELYVPVVGGGTSNTEFEILTGLTLKLFYSDWYMIYSDGIEAPMVSLASILRKQGYETVGVHPFHSWYYKRNQVYRHLGFNTFKSMEFINHPDTVGGLVSDKYITEEIIREIESSDAPLFNFSVTMQNHGPYSNQRFEPDEVTIEVKGDMSDDTRYALTNYVQGLELSDIALGRLIEYLRESDEPTLVLFYGDHLPMLGEDYKAFRETGYVGNESSEALQETLDMMAVPYILWANYPIETGHTPTENMSFMGPKLLDAAGLDMPEYMKQLFVLSKQMPLYFRGFGYDAAHVRIEGEDPRYVSAKARYQHIYEAAQSDDQWKILDNSDYNSALSAVVKEAINDGGKAHLTGSGFHEGMTAKLDGEDTGFTYVSDHEAYIDKPLSAGNVLALMLLDSQGKELARGEYTCP